MTDDRRHLAHAVALAGGDEARTSPNPTVGCVLVGPDDTVVATGRTEPPGGRHAEVVALDAAGASARGTTAHVSLEPCDHTGRTGPCSVALVAAGVRRVVVAQRDPVAGHGGGIQRLRAAGVEVAVVDDGGWSAAASPRFLRRAVTGRPWVTCKLAHDEDGATVSPQGWITGPTARRRVHAQRATHDAVLVGVGTVRADDPGLDVRHVVAAHGQPRPVVLDSAAGTPPDARVVARGALVVVAEDAPARRRAALVERGAEVAAVPRDGDHLDLAAALAAVADHGLHAVYAEPGDTLSSALVVAGAVDQLVLHRPRGAVAARPAAWGGGRGWRWSSSALLGADREDVWRPDTGR